MTKNQRIAKRFDVIVAGIGAMGSATCYEIARRGGKVLGLEQFGIPTPLGSSGGESRLFRLCYSEHPDYVPLLLRARELWIELGERIGARVFHETGALYLGPESGELVGGATRSAREHGIPHEIRNPEEVRRDYPQFTVPGACAALYEPLAGVVLPEPAIAGFAELAIAHGAELHGLETVRHWEAGPDAVSVTTEAATYTADRLILCAGAWSAAVAGHIGAKLTVTRQVTARFAPCHPERFAPGRCPAWVFEDGLGGVQYGSPHLPPVPGIKVGRHVRGPPADPESIDRRASRSEIGSLLCGVRRFMPDDCGPLLSATVCMYTNSPDGHFVIDHHPRHGNVICACGFSGHGFKFAPAVGEALAELALEGRSRRSVAFLGLERFGETPEG